MYDQTSDPGSRVPSEDSINHSGEPEDVRKWVSAIDEFEVWMRGDSKSERTITQRRYQLGVLAEDHLARSPWRVTTVQLGQWLASYDWSPATRATYVSTLKVFYAWAHEIAGYAKRNPAAKLKAPRLPKPVPRPVPDAVVDGALQRCTDRDRLILLLGELAGLRRAEVAALRWEHIDDKNLHVVRGKGRKNRSIPLDVTLKQTLDAERARRAGGEYGTGFRYRPADDHGYVFPSRDGGHVTPHTIGLNASNILGPGWTDHALRHRFGSLAYETSGDLRVVADLMGHSRLDTTAGYARIPGDAHRTVIDGVGRRRRDSNGKDTPQ